MMGDCIKETVFELLGTFFGLGGIIIDTTNLYRGGQSEKQIGE